MSGKDAIIEKIIEDARLVASSVTEEATKKSMEILRVAQDDAKLYAEKHALDTEKDAEEIVQRMITSANLEVKKMILASKQKVMKNTFDSALKAIRADKSYKDLLIGMLARADEGDEITFSQFDKKFVTEKWFNETTVKLNKKLFMNKEFGNFAGGILIKGKGSDKNYTLEVELEGVKEEYEPQIAEILFGE